MQFLTSLGGNLREKLVTMAPDILLIGTGITSALSANFLQKTIPASNIIIWDKARGIGGRMSRSVCPKDSTCSADLGAQYITTNTETMAKYDDIYGSLIKEGLIEEMTARVQGMRTFPNNVRHFVAPQGMNSVVKYFLRNIPKENIQFGSRVTAIDEENGRFVVRSEENSRSADVVISTMPVPQFLQLSGVKFPVTDWDLRYLDDEVFRYVSIDNMKRNRPDEPVAVIFHTSVKFGLDNLEKTLPDMENVLVKHVKDTFPDWPEPTAIRCHKWRFSQVVESFKDKPGCLLLNRNPTLILGGDAFSDSNLDGCIYSASKIVEAVRQTLH